MYSESDIHKVCVGYNDSILRVINLMNENGLGIVLVIDQDRRLVGTITDGDMRRAILGDINLEMPVADLLKQKKGSLRETPITARAGLPQGRYAEILQKHRIFHLPLVDQNGRIVGLVTVEDLMPQRSLPVQALVMAGGKGTRMRPLTDNVPKPMLPIGDRPLLERIIEQLCKSGIHKVNITTHYKAEKITKHFGDGSGFGVELNYVREDRPLGTAGALKLMDVPQEPMLVVNGDILTEIDFRAMLSYHQEHGADLTVAVRKYDLQVPYGVIECDGVSVRSLQEKPLLYFFVNAGVYLLEPNVYEYIPEGEYFDMTDLIQRLLNAKREVISFPIREYWLDIGQPADYEQAQVDVRDGRVGKKIVDK